MGFFSNLLGAAMATPIAAGVVAIVLLAGGGLSGWLICHVTAHNADAVEVTKLNDKLNSIRIENVEIEKRYQARRLALENSFKLVKKLQSDDVKHRQYIDNLKQRVRETGCDQLTDEEQDQLPISLESYLQFLGRVQ